MYIGWERFGVVTTAEIFVVLSGIVVGMVYGKAVKNKGLTTALPKVFDRAIALYRANIMMILIIIGIRYIPLIDSSSITSYYSRYSGNTFQLFPARDAPIWQILREVMLLHVGPHQFQIIGMYVAMFAVFTPLSLGLLSVNRWKLLMALSCGMYIYNSASADVIRIFNMQYEWAFPTLAWQFLYINAIIVGYYKQTIIAFFYKPLGIAILAASAILSFGFMLFSWCHPLDEFAGTWAQLSFISPDKFNEIYNLYFQKNRLGIGRLFNLVVLFLTTYAVLTIFWKPLHKLLGWFLIPLGQASLYVFIMHIFLILLLNNTPFIENGTFWSNTLVHTALFAIIWIMVKKKFLYRWVPH
jgi:hypothetical protein